MILNSEAPWVFDKSPHTGQPKTMHCIPALPDDRILCKLNREIEAVLDAGISAQGWRPRVRFKVGGEYCVKSEQRAPALGRIKVEHVRLVDVMYDHNRALYEACGFGKWLDFIEVWAHRHDTEFYDDEILGKKLVETKLLTLLLRRPIELYTAWAITFAPVP